MGKRGRRERPATQKPAPAPGLDGSVILPRSIEALNERGQKLVAELQETTRQLRGLEKGQREQVAKLRAAGVSWSAIGWAVGTSGSAARQRWGDPTA